MYKKIIVATDGSDIAQKATEQAVQLAKALKAELAAVLVTEPYQAVAFTIADDVVDPSTYNQRTRAHAESVLSQVKKAADAEGITCQTIHQDSHWPYDGIIKAANGYGADLIVVGSHGRRGLEGLLLGSQAMKVLTHTSIPTLVVR